MGPSPPSQRDAIRRPLMANTRYATFLDQATLDPIGAVMNDAESIIANSDTAAQDDCRDTRSERRQIRLASQVANTANAQISGAATSGPTVRQACRRGKFVALAP